MSLCFEGLSAKSGSTSITMFVNSKDPMMALANTIDWQSLSELVTPDLSATTKYGHLWRGRKLYLRAHLAVLILQSLLKETDRGIESLISRTPLYQVFCGFGLIKKWHCPDHTKIEKFRNRLSSGTHKAICDHVLKLAVSLGFGDPSWMDLDSTVQEANISYPSDASLMLKLSKKCAKVLEHFQRTGKRFGQKLSVNISAIAKASKSYFFLAKNAAMEKRRDVFQKYYALVKSELKDVIKFCEDLKPQTMKCLPWNISKASKQIADHGWRLLLDIAHFIRNHHIKKGKILSLHCLAVACIKKGKLGKEHEFGRVFQIGRIGGNFLIPFICTDLQMSDKKSFIPATIEHANLFGSGKLKSIATDKGYYSYSNVKYLEKNGIDGDGIQRPVNIKRGTFDKELAHTLRSRRAGIEPLIGHVKEWGLRKSRMKSDQATLSSGYRSVTGFNLHQLMRHMTKIAA